MDVTMRFPALVVVALAVTAGGGCRRGGDATNARAEAAPQPTTLAPENVAVVEERVLQTGPEISGTLRARRAAALRAEVGGAVERVLAEAGDHVRQGQPLARIDAPALRDTVIAARSGVTAARNGLAVADSAARRARTLAEAGALAIQDAERAEAQLEAARAQLADARARLASAEQQAGKVLVRSPFAGVVSERSVSVGDVVAAGTPLLTVIDPARLELAASIPAARLGEVRPGADVDFTVTGFGARPFAGRIARINPAVDPATGQVRIYVDVPNEDGRLVAGLHAEGRVTAEERRAPAAPETVVDATTTPPTVLRVQGGKVERVPVEVAVRDDVAGAVGFGSGVRVGDVLVLGSARGTLAEGTPVRVVGEERATGEAEGGAR